MSDRTMCVWGGQSVCEVKIFIVSDGYFNSYEMWAVLAADVTSLITFKTVLCNSLFTSEKSSF